jgi:hypothetical protein
MRFILTRPALLLALSSVALFVARFGHQNGGRGFHQW